MRYPDDRLWSHLVDLTLIALLAEDHDTMVVRHAKTIKRGLRKTDVVSRQLVDRILTARAPAALAARVYREYISCP